MHEPKEQCQTEFIMQLQKEEAASQFPCNKSRLWSSKSGLRDATLYGRTFCTLLALMLCLCCSNNRLTQHVSTAPNLKRDSGVSLHSNLANAHSHTYTFIFFPQTYPLLFPYPFLCLASSFQVTVCLTVCQCFPCCVVILESITGYLGHMWFQALAKYELCRLLSLHHVLTLWIENQCRLKWLANE